jgi:hypothetical protein
VALTEQGKNLYRQAEKIPNCMREALSLSADKEMEIVRMIPSLDELINELKKLNQ